MGWWDIFLNLGYTLGLGWVRLGLGWVRVGPDWVGVGPGWVRVGLGCVRVGLQPPTNHVGEHAADPLFQLTLNSPGRLCSKIIFCASLGINRDPCLSSS